LTFVDRFLDWAHNGLLENEDAQAYLRGRGISSEQWDRHRLGFVSGGFDVDPREDPAHGDACFDREKKHLRCDICHYRSWSAVWEEQEGEERRIMRVGHRILNSVVFPLTTYTGATIGFQIRSIVEKSYDTFALRRRPEGYFFGASAAMESIWATKEVWLVESPGDQLLIERLVAPNVLALTTSAVNKIQTRFLGRYVDTVNLCLDLDKAGRDGVESFMKYSGTRFRVRNVKYPRLDPVKDKDPGDYWKKVGDQRFTEYFRKSVLSTF